MVAELRISQPSLNRFTTMAAFPLQSVLEILNRVVAEFPEAVLREYLQFLFVPLVMRLVNDDVAACRCVGIG